MTPAELKGQEWRERMQAQADVLEDAGKRIAADFLRSRIIADARLEAALSPSLNRMLGTSEYR